MFLALGFFAFTFPMLKVSALKLLTLSLLKFECFEKLVTLQFLAFDLLFEGFTFDGLAF